jgi:nickel superoxide dismutase
MNLLATLIKVLPLHPVYAHCDIPCGIYDPHAAQVAAHTVIRMTKQLQEALRQAQGGAGEDMHKMIRLAKVKEDHAEIVKREVTILWGDYFKPEHLEKFPDLHNDVWNILKLASKTKQNIDIESANQLLTAVQKLAEQFYQSKGLDPVRVSSGFPTEGEIVTHK